MPDPFHIRPESLGHPGFLADHGVRYAYVAGAMAKGIGSADLVVRMGRAGLLGYYGSGGQRLEVVEAALRKIRGSLRDGEPFGVNLLHNIQLPHVEEETVDLLLRWGVREAEAAAFIHMTPALVRYRLHGAHRGPDGRPVVPQRVLGKASRPEVAARFLAPPPADLVQQLLAAGRISGEAAELAAEIPMADDLCAEADSGGHTDKQVAAALVPTFLRLRDEAAGLHRYARPPRVGAAGGLGTPEAVAASFALGSEFVLTGSVNQCTVEAGTSDLAKDLLAAAGIQDTEMCPAGDMFEIGARVQVLKRGVLFPARANHLYELYRRHESLEQIDPAVCRTIQEKYFKRSFAEVWDETRGHYLRILPAEVERAEQNPKQKMAMVFRWYFVHSNRLALQGRAEDRVDFQIHCGPAMGACNRWLADTPWSDWRSRHVDQLGERLMEGAAEVLSRQMRRWLPALTEVRHADVA